MLARRKAIGAVATFPRLQHNRRVCLYGPRMVTEVPFPHFRDRVAHSSATLALEQVRDHLGTLVQCHAAPPHTYCLTKWG
jgi:hypothetical protein